MKQLDSNFWNKYFKVYDILNQVIPYQELLDDLVRELEVKKGDLILDAGSGTGNLAVKLEKLGAKVIALDNNSEAIKRHKQKSPNTEIIQHDLNKPLPFKDNYFDKIVCVNTLYLLPIERRKEILNEFYRCLKHNGKIVLANPHISASPIKIFISHIRKSFNQVGLFNTIKEIVSLIKYVFLLLHYNSIIKFNNRIFYSRFLKKGEQKLLLNKKFINISQTRLIYANQVILNSAYKLNQQDLRHKFKQANIIIRIPSSQDEYVRACKLIEKVYKEHGYIEYFKSNPSILFISLSNSDILGTIGLIIEACQNGDRFPTEDIFNFSFKDYINVNNVKIAEISRLAVIDSQIFGLTRGLFLAVYRYVSKFHINYCIASVKPDLYDIIKNKLQIPIHKINKQVDRGRVPKCYSGYFLHKPLPIPIYINTQEMSGIFKKVEDELNSRVDIVVNNNNGADRITNFDKLSPINSN